MLSFIWGLLKNNLLLKIMAVLFAVILWSYVLAEENPVRDRFLPDIPVRYDSEAELNIKGFAISNSLSERLDKVDIHVRVTQSNLQNYSVQARVDLSGISSEGVYKLDITWSSTNCTVVEVSPSTVTLTIEDYVPRTLPVAVHVAGSVAPGYYAGEAVAQPDTVTILGARTDVELASRAVCNIDLTGLTEWDKKSMEVTILDARGKEVDPSLFDSLPSVVIDMSILPKKTVRVNVSDSILGQDGLSPGYEIVGNIICDPAYVEIVGEASLLSGINAVSLVPYSISGASSDVVVPLGYDLPGGVSVLGSNQALVTVTIREKTVAEQYTGVDIDVRNLGGGLSANLAQDEVDVTVIAGETEMSHLRASEVVPYIDLKGKGVGTYTVDIMFEIPDGFTAENFTPSIVTVAVTITRR